MADNKSGTRNASLVQHPPGMTVGKIVLDATAIVVTDHLRVETGFKPRYVRWMTGAGVILEWFEGMAANTCFKTAADGTRTVEATGITVDARGFRVLQAAALAGVLASSTNYYTAQV